MTAAALEVATDELGFLLDPADWDRELALVLAERIGVELGPEHWRLIEFVREWYETRQTVPEARRVLKAMRELLGEDKATRRYLYRLFPQGYGPGLCLVAGMIMPRKVMLDV